MTTGMNLFDLIIVICGAYLIYASINMKRTGTISGTAMIGKGIDLKKAKDVPGFINYMYGKSIILGVITILCGALDYLNETYWMIQYMTLITCAVYLVVIFVYCKMSMDAQKKYLSQN